MINISPNEAEPDGEVFAPHHYLQGAALALVVSTFTGNWIVDLGAVAGIFGFLLCWREELYPATGAVISGVGMGVWAVGGFIEGGIPGVLVLIAAVVAFDDWFEHATGIWTPLDTIWNQWLYYKLPSTRTN